MESGVQSQILIPKKSDGEGWILRSGLVSPKHERR